MTLFFPFQLLYHSTPLHNLSLHLIPCPGLPKRGIAALSSGMRRKGAWAALRKLLVNGKMALSPYMWVKKSPNVVISSKCWSATHTIYYTQEGVATNLPDTYRKWDIIYLQALGLNLKWHRLGSRDAIGCKGIPMALWAKNIFLIRKKHRVANNHRNKWK